MTYRAPLADILFTLDEVVGLEPLRRTGAFDDLDDDLVRTVLEEAGKLAVGVMAPLNRGGDQIGARLENGQVRAAPGFGDAYAKFVEGGWNAVPFDPEHGGQGMPWMLATAILELWHASNMAFALCPLLTQGAVEAVGTHGTPELKAKYLEKLVSGEWTGTMNLTEPHAGSDVGALTSRAVPTGDGGYAITGTKIFITYGDHDMAPNIIHLVLARLPDAPVGTRGISLFLVPKFLVNDDGSLGARNDVTCVSIEEKLGIHGSPTCVLSFGENGGAKGWLIGTENRGMACMFTMMNNARLGVGLQGVAIAERAFQQALAFAQERRQGKPVGQQHETKEMVAIVAHPDVRRMLWTMKSLAEAGRALCYATAQALDLSKCDPDEAARERHRARAELLTPIAKAFCTDAGVEVASIGIQVHGGMGFIEETGAAQYWRDSRIAPIYEGTNGIQAIDLVSRKLPMLKGGVLGQLLSEIEVTLATLKTETAPDFAVIATHLGAGTTALRSAGAWLLAQSASAPNEALAGATPFLRQAGLVIGGWFLAKGALAAQARLGRGEGAAGFLKAKIALARFFAEHQMAQAAGLGASIIAGADPLFAIDPEALAG